MSRERADRSYRLEPLDTSGIFLGLGLVQCILLGGGIALAVIILSAGAPLPVAAVSVVVGAAGSFTRIGGYATWEWVPLLAGWTWTRLGRGRRWTGCRQRRFPRPERVCWQQGQHWRSLQGAEQRLCL